jgi:GABA(A) receptor-associated protein
MIINSKMDSFKYKYIFSQRKHDCEQILLKYPNNIPVICEKYPYSKNAPEIDKHKYLIGSELTVGQFMLVIRKRMNVKPEIGLYIFINGIIHSNSSLLRHLYNDFKDDDGFLYIEYDIENTFGDNSYFENNDIIYLIKDNIIDKTVTYTIHSVEIIKGGDWHDGFSETYYGLLENNTTKIIEKNELAYINLM